MIYQVSFSCFTSLIKNILSKVKKEMVNENDKKDLLNIIEACPVSAIVIEDEKEA